MLNCPHQGGPGMPPLSVQSASSRYNMAPGWSASSLVADWLSWPASIVEKGEVLFVLQQTLWISVFLTAAKTTLHTLTECRNSSSWYSTQHCFWSKGSLHTKLSQRSFTGITMFSNSLQHAPLDIRPQPWPQPWTPTICDQTLCLSAWISSACFQTLCHRGLPTSWDTICYTWLAFLDSSLPSPPLPARTASPCCRHHAL